MLKPELEEQNFGSSFDPVLNGVAHGLARLFPPIENVHPSERDEDASDRAASESDGRGVGARS